MKSLTLLNFWLLFLLLFLLSFPSFAVGKLYQVQMLNKDGSKGMNFKPSYLKINKGDSVEFLPTAKGHNTRSLFTPDNAKKWKSKTSQKYLHKFEVEGSYIYDCSNHGVMGMVGLIQVGTSKDTAKLQNFLKNHKKKLIMNKDRLTKLFKKASSDQK